MISKVVRVDQAATSIRSSAAVSQACAVRCATRAKTGSNWLRAAGVKTGAASRRWSRHSWPSALNRPSPTAGASMRRTRPGLA